MVSRKVFCGASRPLRAGISEEDDAETTDDCEDLVLILDDTDDD